LAYNFNNNLEPSTADDRESPSPMSPGPSPGPSPTAAPAPATSDVPESAAFVRFRSCRWQQPKDESSSTEFCTHREVKPYAGMTGFDPNAWCTDCQYYKLRRAPKKRSPDSYNSY
jgi:hypothetical protein